MFMSRNENADVSMTFVRELILLTSFAKSPFWLVLSVRTKANSLGLDFICFNAKDALVDLLVLNPFASNASANKDEISSSSLTTKIISLDIAVLYIINFMIFNGRSQAVPIWKLGAVKPMLSSVKVFILY